MLLCPMVHFAVQVWTCGPEPAAKILFLTGWSETQVTGQHRLITYFQQKLT